MNFNLPFTFTLPDYIYNILIVTGNIVAVIASIFAIFFLFLISYSVVRILEIRKQEKKYLEHEIAEFSEHKKIRESQSRESKDKSRNPRWQKVLALVFSQNEADWKLAIIEADSMLDDLTDQMGFKGENLGEKLKVADRDTFRSLTTAWEVHNIRNRIAHEGSAFELPAREAKRIIALYEQIFREFGYI